MIESQKKQFLVSGHARAATTRPGRKPDARRPPRHHAASAPTVAAAVFSLALLAAAAAGGQDLDDAAAARLAYAEATPGSAAQADAAVDLGFALLRRATQGAGGGAAAAAADLRDAEQVFRDTAGDTGSAAEQAEAGLIATLLAQSPYRDGDAAQEMQSLGSRDHGGLSLCLAMWYLSGTKDGDTPDDVASRNDSNDRVNDLIHAFAPDAPYISDSQAPSQFTMARSELPSGPGVVEAKVVLDSSGEVTQTMVTRQQGSPEFVNAVLTGLTFEPVLRDGTPVNFCATLEVTVNAPQNEDQPEAAAANDGAGCTDSADDAANDDASTAAAPTDDAGAQDDAEAETPPLTRVAGYEPGTTTNWPVMEQPAGLQAVSVAMKLPGTM